MGEIISIIEAIQERNLHLQIVLIMEAVSYLPSLINFQNFLLLITSCPLKALETEFQGF